MLSTTNSMSPLIKSRDKITTIIKRKTYELNDILVFVQDRKVIAHRLIHIFPNGNYLTMGDNNQHPDPPISHDRVLGKATQLKSGKTTHSINSIYQSQSFTYLTELKLLTTQCKKVHLPLLFLKGLPIYLKHTHDIPKRILLDTDILIKPTDYPRLTPILSSLGYEPIPTPPASSQISFIKPTPLAPVVLDIHLEPAVAFTKLPQLNQLLPQLSILNDYLWQRSRLQNISGHTFRLLSPNAQYLFLLTHAFHHSFLGIHRWQLIKTLTPQVNTAQLIRDIKLLKLDSLIYPTLYLLSRIYPSPSVVGKTTQVNKRLSPNLTTRTFSHLSLSHPQPWKHTHPLISRIILLFWTLVTSPLPTLSKLTIIFRPTNLRQSYSTINSRFFRSST